MTKQDRNMQQNTGGTSDRQDPLGKQERRQGNVQERENYVDRQDSNIDQGLEDRTDIQDKPKDQRAGVRDQGLPKDQGFTKR